MPHPRLAPYKEIVIKVFPDFVPRLCSRRAGKFSRGITSGLSVGGYLSFLFEINEYLPQGHKLTDFQIAKCCASEFPKRKRMIDLLGAESGRIHKKKGRRTTHSVAAYRQRYNKGVLVSSTNGMRVGPISFRYNSVGERISRFSGNPLSEAEFGKIMAAYGPETRQTQDFDWKARASRQWNKKPKKNSYEAFDWCI